MNLGLLVALENANKMLPYIQWIFNTGPYGEWGKTWLLHVLNFMTLGLLVA